MYQRIWKDYRQDFFKRNPRFPKGKSFSVGRALWAISREKGIKFIELARKTGIEEGSLLRMSASHKLTSTPERIRALADALGVSLDEFLRAAREEFYGNFFITKSRMPSDQEVRDYARRGLILQRQTILRYPDSPAPDFRVVPYTPPVESLVDFFAAAFLLSPGKGLRGLKIPRPARIYLAVTNGAVKIQGESNGKSGELVAGQAASFNGNVKHSVLNLSLEREAEILMVLKPTQLLAKETPEFAPKALKDAWDIPTLIEEIRRYVSPDPENPVPLSEVALLSGMSAWELGKLSKGEFMNLPIDKLERLAELIGAPLEDLSRGLPFSKGLDLQITKGDERGICDYRTHFGVTLYPWTKLGMEKRECFMGKVGLETPFPVSEAGAPHPSNLELKEKLWRGKSSGYFMAKGLSGQLEARLGMRHAYAQIEQEDTVYLDTSLGYSFRNFSTAEPTNLFLVASAALP